MLARLHTQFSARGDWFFSAWQPEEVRDGAHALRFEDAPAAMLAETPACWMLEPHASWHGFDALEPDYCLLDPIKVTVVTPGISPSGKMAEAGIPAALLSAYLAERGIIVEKTANFSILFLFSIGVTKGKWGSLINALMEFKRDYEANTPLPRAMPTLAASHSAAYGTQGVKDLAEAMFQALRVSRMPQLLETAYTTEPHATCTPAAAYDRLVRGESARAGLAELADGVAATAIVPYPPGIPLLMPGEAVGAQDGPVLRYLLALQEFDRQFPGFEHETHGITVEGGTYYGRRHR